MVQVSLRDTVFLGACIPAGGTGGLLSVVPPGPTSGLGKFARSAGGTGKNHPGRQRRKGRDVRMGHTGRHLSIQLGSETRTACCREGSTLPVPL